MGTKATPLEKLYRRYRHQVHYTLSKQIPWSIDRAKQQAKKIHPRGNVYRRLMTLEAQRG